MHCLIRPSALRHRGSIGLSRLCLRVRAGDVLLFRCRMPHCVAQRALTGSEFDHIAIVTSDGPGAMMIEAISDGVCSFEMGPRLLQYAHHFAEWIVWRPLQCERPAAFARAMDAFVDAVSETGHVCVFGSMNDDYTQNRRGGDFYVFRDDVLAQSLRDTFVASECPRGRLLCR